MRTLKMWMAAGLVLCTATAVMAAKPTQLGDGKGQVILTWDEFVKITGYDPTKPGKQVLTIPWKEVEDLLGVEIKTAKPMDKTTVDLPWSEFKALLEWSVQRKKPKEETPPPTDFIVTSCQYTGTLDDESAKMTLNLKLNVLREKGWKHIPVLPLNVAVSKSSLPEGVYLNAGCKGYELLTEKSGPLDVTLEFSVQTVTRSGISAVSFGRVLAGSSVLDLTVAGDKVDVKVAGAQSLVTKVAGKNTHVAAAIPSGPGVGITWERAIEKVVVPTKLYAETQTLVAVGDGMLIC